MVMDMKAAAEATETEREEEAETAGQLGVVSL